LELRKIQRIGTLPNLMRYPVLDFTDIGLNASSDLNNPPKSKST